MAAGPVPPSTPTKRPLMMLLSRGPSSRLTAKARRRRRRRARCPRRGRFPSCRDRSPLAALIEDGQLLEACGCDLLALPCNTAHGFFDELQGALGIPVVHMVRETAAAASAVGLARGAIRRASGSRGAGGPAARSGLRRRRARLHRAVLGFRRRDAGGRTSRGRRLGRTSRLRHHACRPAVENLEKLVTSKLAI